MINFCHFFCLVVYHFLFGRSHLRYLGDFRKKHLVSKSLTGIICPRSWTDRKFSFWGDALMFVPRVTCLLAVQTGKLMAVDTRSWYFLHWNVPLVAVILLLILFLLFLPIEGYALCFFTEISKETLFLTLKKIHGSHTLGLRNCEYILSKYEHKKLTVL